MLEGVLASVLNKVLASYVDGLNTSQLNVGIWSGDVKLRNLRLKTSALDKFRLPIDVKEGYLGDLTLSIPWSNLKGKPVRILVENVYLLAAPKNSSVEVDEEEEDQRAQAAKQEKLTNAELLGRDSGQSVGMSSEDEQRINPLPARSSPRLSTIFNSPSAISTFAMKIAFPTQNIPSLLVSRSQSFPPFLQMPTGILPSFRTAATVSTS